MSIAETPRHLFGPSSLATALDPSHSDKKPALGFWDSLSKSQKRQAAKSDALDQFRITAMQARHSPLFLLRTVLDHAKVDALPLIKASYGDITLDGIKLPGGRLDFSIDGKPVSFDYSRLVSFSAADAAHDAAARADARNYTLAHEIAAQAVKPAKTPDAARIGKLREAIFKALQNTDPNADAARANAVSFDPDVRQCLNDLGLTTFVIGAGADRSGRVTFTLSDLWDDLKGHIPKAGKDDVAQAMGKLAFRFPLGERLLNLTVALRKLADPQKKVDFRAGYKTDGGNASFHFRLGDREVALPAVPAGDAQTSAIARKIAIDSIQEALSVSPFGSACRNLISRLTDAAFPNRASPTAEALARLSDQLDALLKLARARPGNGAWEQDARQTIIAAERFIVESMPDSPQKKAQLAALEAVANPDARKPDLFAGSAHGRAVEAAREQTRHALAKVIAESDARAKGITLAEQTDPISYVENEPALAAKLAEKLGEADPGIRMRIDSVAPKVQIQKFSTLIRDQVAALRNADPTTVPTLTFVPQFVGSDRGGFAGLFVNGEAVAWAPASDAGRNRAPSPSAPSTTGILEASTATTVPLDDDKSRSSSVASFSGAPDLSGGQSPSFSASISK